MPDVQERAHDAASYTKTYNLSPDETKALELAQQEAARNEYQRAARASTRQFAGLTGRPDPYIPVLSSIAPTTKVKNTGDFVLTCTGTGFHEDSKVYWGSVALVTTFVSTTSVTAVVPNAQIQTASTVQVTVKTDDSASGTKPFTIT